MPQLRLKGKTALVFGGARGIGAAAALRLAKEGADVGLTYVSAPDAAEAVAAGIREAGGRSLAVKADSADAEAIARAAEAVVDALGGLDIAVVNAGVLALGPIADATVADLDRSLDVNLRGAFLAVQAAQKHIRPGGRIITIGSNVSNRAAAGASVYAMTKAGVAHLARSAALELAPRGITVNNIQPGPIVTDMTREMADQILPAVPIGRLGAPEEIAALVAYLASDEAGYMTGASLTIDGGMSL